MKKLASPVLVVMLLVVICTEADAGRRCIRRCRPVCCQPAGASNCTDKGYFTDLHASRSGNTVTLTGNACIKVQSPNRDFRGACVCRWVCAIQRQRTDLNGPSVTVSVGNPNAVAATVTADIEGGQACVSGSVSALSYTRGLGKQCAGF